MQAKIQKYKSLLIKQSKNSNNTDKKALSHINTVDQINFMLIKCCERVKAF